jgi:hypothetical protein
MGEDVIDPHAAGIIQEMAQRVIAGDSLRAIASDLNQRGVPAPGAGRVIKRDQETKKPIAWASPEWCPKKVRSVLARESNVGVRIHHIGGDGSDIETRRYDAGWGSILDRDVYDRVIAILHDPARRTSRSSVTSHWLSGIARCGTCGGVVTVQKSKKSNPKAPKYEVYRCPGSHVSKAKARTDLVVETWVLEWLASDEARATYGVRQGSDREALLQRHESLRGKLTAVERDWIADAIDDASYGRLTTQLRAKLAEIASQLRASRDESVYSELLECPIETLAELWELIPIGRRRAIVSALFDIQLLPATHRGRNAFDPETIRIQPKGAM